MAIGSDRLALVRFPPLRRSCGWSVNDNIADVDLQQSSRPELGP